MPRRIFDRPGEHTVPKPELGLKRTCQACGAKFYDLGKAQIACPKCGAGFDPDAATKTRRPKAERAPPPQPAPEEAVEEVETEEAGEEADGQRKDKGQAAGGLLHALSFRPARAE